MTQGMYEQDVVNKENELRSRDNIISGLQSKIHSLESTLAKCLKKQVADSGQAKPMVDLNLWMSSPLTAFTHSEALTPSKVAGPSKPVKTSAEEDDISDVSDDDKPLCDDPVGQPATTLGKRDRPEPDEPARPARRTKAAAPKKTVPPPPERKAADTSAKAKPKKRR
ncbi:hypothetical protein BDZ89DRAFT_532430 [Hymenopellis radicata]|nr:hypothetical protein BDZ89DRAFT_532430 [Hymenopellis radicata]